MIAVCKMGPGVWQEPPSLLVLCHRRLPGAGARVYTLNLRSQFVREMGLMEAGKGGCIQRTVTGSLRSGSVVWSVYLGCGAKPVC